jgi:integrase
LVPEQIVFRDFALRWLEEVQPTVAQSTTYGYGRPLEACILPSSFAAKNIDEVYDGDIKRLIAELQANGLGPRSINIVIARLRTVFSAAKIRKLRSDNPVDYVHNLREKKPEIDPFTLDEVEALLRVVRGSERTLVTVLIFEGLRPGEALGLLWADVDFHEGLIKVRRHVSRFGVGLPKTTSSERDVIMLAPVRKALQEQRARSQLRSEFIFVNEGGQRPYDLDNIRQRNWIQLLRRAGLRHRPLYRCRHTYATLLLRTGEDMRFVASQMGHTTLAMLIRHYARWSRRSPAGGNAINSVLEASGLSKMPEFCQKTASGGGCPVQAGGWEKLIYLRDLLERVSVSNRQPCAWPTWRGTFHDITR